MDVVIRGGTVIDGTGEPGVRADVALSGGKVAQVAPSIEANGAEVVDASGLVVAPGFIDIHTHYDAQVLWDPDLTPSSWHGVTTVVMGNCGFGIAPTRPEHRGTIARTLENVEGMSVEALEAGIDWSFETFPEYLATLDRIEKRLNVGAMIGHTPLRLYVLGDEATDRVATADEVAQMRATVAEAIEAGALGFATSKSPTHSGAGGKPVPSRLAEVEEIFTIAGALGDAGRGIIQATPGPGFFLPEFAELSKRTGRPLSWTALLTGVGRPGSTAKTLTATTELGGDVWPQIACRPLVMQLTLEDPFPLETLAPFKELLAIPRHDRARLYRDAAWMDRARPEVDHAWARRWPKVTIQETTAHPGLLGANMAELAGQRGQNPFDLAVELSLAEDLGTRFRVVLVNDDEDELAGLLLDERAVLGLSDAGAHASQLCDACFSTYLLQHWVREKQVLSLEQAVWRLTGHAASVFRLAGRGRLAEGYGGDVTVFDPERVGASELERVHDLPAGADRLVSYSEGVEHVFVNGTAIRMDGKEIEGARPGALVRNSA